MKNLKHILKKFALLNLFGLLCINLNAQENSNKQNSVFISYGSIINSSQVSIAYERLILKKDNFSTKIKATYGEFLTNNADYEQGARVYENWVGIGGVQLLGPFELNLGVAYAKYNLASGFGNSSGIERLGNPKDFIFNGSFGLRYEKNNLLARVGLGNFELVYLGIGMSF
jgi:hypothetical protein